MTAGITSLAIRSSPTRRSILQRAAQLAHVHALGPQSLTSTVSMLPRAKQQPAKGPPQRTVVAKHQPTSSPQALRHTNILDQLKPTAANRGAASASARTTYALSNTPHERSSNMNQPLTSRTLAGSGPRPIQSLYSNPGSFKHEPNVIDLTSPEAQARAMGAVDFAEEDFSDDEDLDLDYEAPSALPAPPPAPITKSLVKENMPPPPLSTQPETSIPWSSSPAEHLLPPQPQRSWSGISSTTDKSLKRESSGDRDSFESGPEAPVPKKAKRRVLPACFKQEDPEDEDEGYLPTPSIKTPSHSKSKGFLDPSASAVKEQKRQLKLQRQPRKGDVGASAEDIQEVTKSHAKKSFAPISLTEEQRHVLDLVVNQNQSVFFTGPAGTGKSVLMRAIITDLKKKHAKDPERVAVTASTGLAACNIGGITLHSFSGKYFPKLCSVSLKLTFDIGIGLGKEDAPTLVKKIRRNPKAKNRWLRTKCLVIDEVSMEIGRAHV